MLECSLRKNPEKRQVAPPSHKAMLRKQLSRQVAKPV